jgi:integrase
MLLNEDVRGLGQRARVHWRNPHVSRLFWDLHSVYLRHVRPVTADHPYYFVNLSGSGFGRPMTTDAVDEALSRALRRMHLRPDATRGLSPHAMRHRYAQALVDAHIPPQFIQICLHHRSLASQLTYTRPFPHQIAAALEAAAIRIDLGLADFNPSALGVKWRSDPLGIFSTTAPDIPAHIAGDVRATPAHSTEDLGD